MPPFFDDFLRQVSVWRWLVKFHEMFFSWPEASCSLWIRSRRQKLKEEIAQIYANHTSELEEVDTVKGL